MATCALAATRAFRSMMRFRAIPVHFSSSSEGKKDLSHVDPSSNMPRMVDVGEKATSARSATAVATVAFPADVAKTLRLGKSDDVRSAKGPVITTATIAGVMGAKKTADLIPFCHPLAIEDCAFEVRVADEGTSLDIECTVKVSGKTGVEMEALVGASVAALCVYDMTKALSHNIEIRSTRLLAKSK